MTARTATALAPRTRGAGRDARDRLELLSALINGPTFDPTLRPDFIEVPDDHPVFACKCRVIGCGRPRTGVRDLCNAHGQQWRSRPSGVERAEFLRTAQLLGPAGSPAQGSCRICRGLPATNRTLQLCARHRQALERKTAAVTDDLGLAEQQAHETNGRCRAASCPDLACSPLGLCTGHLHRYKRDRRPGGAALPDAWFVRYASHGLLVPVRYHDEAAFRRWCARVDPIFCAGVINLLGLRPLLKAEIKWALFAHGQQQDRTYWSLGAIHWLANDCRARAPTRWPPSTWARAGSGRGTSPRRCCGSCERSTSPRPTRARQASSTGSTSGSTSRAAAATSDLTGISQRWLRDLVWDAMAAKMRSPQRSRSAAPYDHLRRAGLELSAFLEVDAPGGGHDSRLLHEEHMQRFVADQRHRASAGLPALGVRLHGKPTTVTETTRRFTFNYARMFLRPLLETGETERLRLDRAFIVALPSGGFTRGRTRSPFTDEVAQALADTDNLQRLAEIHDPHDRGLRDMWETIVVTGRRAGEVIKLRLECLGRYNGLPMLWHDQTKVGNYDQAIRIPEYIYERLHERQRRSIAWFEDRNGHAPTAAE